MRILIGLILCVVIIIPLNKYQINCKRAGKPATIKGFIDTLMNKDLN